MKSLITLAVILTQLSAFAQKADSHDKTQWELKLQYGFALINYQSTEVQFNSTEINTSKRMDFVERTSAHWYNPFEKGRKIGEALHFLHEPSFDYAGELTNGKYSFYMNILHPKYIQSFYFNKQELPSGLTTYSFSDAPESDDFSQTIPEGQSLGYFASTHKNIHASVGAGRNLKIFDSNGYKLSYTPRVDVGLAMGQARSVLIVPGVAWNDYNEDGLKMHGWLASVGHRIELSKGRLSVFLNQRLVYSDISHEFFDGTIEYKLIYIPTSFGITYQILKSKPKK